MKKIYSVLLIGVCCSFLAALAAAGDMKPLPPADPKQQQQTQQTAAAVVTPPPVQAYEYNARGRRDPFTSLVATPEDEKRKKRTASIDNFEVSDFKLVAILWTGSGYYAVITLPDNKSYTVREGAKLGMHDGKVYKVTKELVVIREQVRDYKGVLITKDTTLKLRREEDDNENGGKN
jgi:Tfp pilus assembly protein PilP